MLAIFSKLSFVSQNCKLILIYLSIQTNYFILCYAARKLQVNIYHNQVRNPYNLLGFSFCKTQVKI